MYAPYTDTTLYPTFDISSVPNVTRFCLGFIVSDRNKNPSWGGYHDIWSDFYKDIIAKIRAQGRKLVCSFGGAAGKELAHVCPTADELFKKYQAVVDMYDFDYLDFDIEGYNMHDMTVNRKRADAILKLKQKNPKLKISLTLPVNRWGLEKDSVEIVKMTQCDLVNIMAMDYNNIKDMGQAACEAALCTRKQTGKDIGVTVMQGRNDTGEVFTLDDARILKKFQMSNPWVKELRIWAIERDRGVKGDLSWSSQIEQVPFEFSKIFI
jgi:chitinase